MSLRDYFASHALSGSLSSNQVNAETHRKCYVILAYAYVDEMIEEGKK